MPDELDQVQQQNEEFLELALSEQQRSREADNNPGIECLDCDEEIPIERRRVKPGCRRCISCQETHEIKLSRRTP